MTQSKNFFLSFFVLSLMLMGTVNAQNPSDAALESITAAELRDHIFFLASDYLNGRVATSPEYEIAAQYVAAQFANAGLQPGVKMEDGSMTFFQGVPFAKTIYNEDLSWTITSKGKVKELVHQNDFKILMSSQLNFNQMGIVWVGYGIDEPAHDWNDFQDLEIQGKIMICMGGAPMKNGKPVLPEEIHQKYLGQRGFQSKISGLFSKGAAGIILIDPDGSAGMDFDQIPSSFSNEKYVYKDDERMGQGGAFPSIYLARTDILKALGIDRKAKPQVIKETFLDCSIEILSENILLSNNVVGIVPGTDPDLKNEFIVVGAHLDHVQPQQGQVSNGADDNASGSAGVLEIAEAIAMNPCRRSVLFVTWTAEEMGLIGSRYFLSSEAYPNDQLKFNMNLDMIGRTDPKNEESRAHFVVTNKRYLHELETFIGGINDGVTDFPLIFDDDDHSPGGSDHQTFIGEGIPAFFFFSGVHRDLHRPTDDADKIDYAKAESISRLGYLLTCKLANMDTVPDFLEK